MMQTQAMSQAAQDREAQEAFESLRAQWEEATAGVSNYTALITHPAYYRMIGLGAAVVPLILRDLANGGGPWFVALSAITGENPVKPEHANDTGKMKEDWLRWGKEHGIEARPVHAAP